MTADMGPTDVDVLIVALADGHAIDVAAVAAKLDQPTAELAARIHGWPHRMGDLMKEAAYLIARYNSTPGEDPLNRRPNEQDQPTAPPTNPTLLPVDDEGDEVVQIPPETMPTQPEGMPWDLDRDVDLADIREHEQELRRARYQGGFEEEAPTVVDADPRITEEYRAKHEERAHEQVPGFTERMLRAQQAAQFMAEMARRARSQIRPDNRIYRTADTAPDAVAYGERHPGPNPRFLQITHAPGGPVCSFCAENGGHCALHPALGTLRPPEETPLTFWAGPGLPTDAAEATAEPLPEVTATPMSASSATLILPMVTMLDGDGVPTVVREAVVDVALDPRGVLDLITGEDARAVPVTWTVRHRITPIGADIIDALAQLLDGEGVPE